MLMAKKSLDQCMTGDDFLKYAKKKPQARIRNGKGSHVIVETDLGSCVLPCHPRDLGTGLRHAIIKAMIAIGLACIIILPLLVQ